MYSSFTLFIPFIALSLTTVMTGILALNQSKA